MLDSLSSFIDSHLDSAFGELARLCAVPSVSAKGQALEPCAEMVAEMMRQRGLEAQVLPTPGGPPVVFGQARASQHGVPTVIFYNHYDVQPAEPLELWESPPFELSLREGKAYARGAGDDKGHIVSRLLALDAVREANGGSYPFHVKFLAEGEEEVGSPHLGAFVQQHADMLRADYCIWEEGGVDERDRPALYCGMRGIAYFELSVRTLARDAHSGGGGSILPNAAWRLVWALASLKAHNERILIPNHYDAAHGATRRDLELLETLPDPERQLSEEFDIPEGGFLGGKRTSGLELKRRAVFEPTLTICGLESGWQGPGAKTVLPAEAKAKADFRLVPDQDPEEVHRSLRAYLNAQGYADVEVRYLGGQRPARVDPDDPWVRAAADAAREVYGVPATVAPIVGGSGPMWWFSSFLGMPVTSPGVEYPGFRPHSPNEHIRVEDFRKGTTHLALLLMRVNEVHGRAAG